MIKINNIKKNYQGVVAVDIPELSVEKGEIVGIVGNNGAGKTTFLRLMLDLIKATNGYISYNNEDVSKTDLWKKSTGSFIDNGFLIEYLTPEEFFSFVASVYCIDKDTLDLQLHKFERFMNGEILLQKKFIRNFSSGNKQKIGIIAAMIMNPRLLILDEPFNFLDPSSQIVIKQLLKTLNTESGTTILISSHNLEHITDISSRIILLEKGLIIKDIHNSSGEAGLELVNYFSLQTA